MKPVQGIIKHRMKHNGQESANVVYSRDMLALKGPEIIAKWMHSGKSECTADTIALSILNT